MKRLVILGGGESGVGAALLALEKGYEVFLSDAGTIKKTFLEQLKKKKIAFESGTHTESIILNADLIVKSPGIPDSATIIQKIYVQKIPVISEIEFGALHSKSTCVAVTGSNGKTTTVMLIHHLLKNGGLDVALAGNIGSSFAKQVAANDKPYTVLEVSSFQLDGIRSFHPHIAVLTNITPDHLDRYDYQFENYIASKFRIAMNLTENDFFIYDDDDKIIRSGLERYPTRAQKIPFSIEKKLDYGTYSDNRKIMIQVDNNPMTIPQEDLTLEGKHNLKNAMAAATVAHLLKIRKTSVQESFQTFEGAPHRMEKVAKVAGVQYINDSKATNINSAYYALDSINGQVLWIVGGEDKGNDYYELLPLVNQKVKAIICLGIDNGKIIDTFQNTIELMAETQSMDEAVRIAYQIAEKGDTVLLSPACASFDLFKNYEDRGNQFKKAVKAL